MENNKLIFAVNGQRFELSSCDPSTTLLEFLRTQTPFKSPKLGCGEGGCGACVVLLSKYDPVRDQVEDLTVSSCLTLLCSVDRCSITTSEGLGNAKDGFHSIHQRFTGFHASQCGFCTPGMCMSLFGALVNASKTDRPEPPQGFSKLTVVEAEKAIAGNLCRCTGYRSVVNACKSFAADVDMEDLGYNSFCKKGDSQETMIGSFPISDRDNEVTTFPEFLKKEAKTSQFLGSERNTWLKPASLMGLQSMLANFEGNNEAQLKLLVGNTGTGYFKELNIFDKYIQLSSIPELTLISRDQEGFTIGAAVSISKAIKSLKEESGKGSQLESEMAFKKIALHMDKIGPEFVRNSGTIGGNLVMAQRKNFPSDIATVLLGVGSFVNVITYGRHEKLTLEEFLGRPPLDSRSILINVEISNPKSIKKSPDEKMDSTLLFETYRAAPRPLGNALPYMNAAFLAEISHRNSSGGVVLLRCQLAFGAYGSKHAIRAKKVEGFLNGKVLTLPLLYESLNLVRTSVVPEHGTSSPAYRSSLAVGFLFDFFWPLVEASVAPPLRLLDGYSSELSKAAKLNRNHIQHNSFGPRTLLLPSKQIFQLSKEYHPVGEPIPKSGAALQASGEAVYVDDIPSTIGCLYGSFIYSTKPLARIKCIGFESKSLPSGVFGLVSFRDIPKGGENVGSKTIFGHERLFADELTQCAGERLALVVADSQKHADLASNLAVIEYDLQNLEPPILSVEDAVKRSSFFNVPSFVYPKQIGNISKGMDEADHKILGAEIRLGSQYHFYLENQSALAVPDEDNCMVVYSSIQCPEIAHSTIAKCLGLPEHNVRVITRRVGGGFGGKSTRAMPVAVACALAAHKLHRPVRMYLNRKTDMIMAGGRHPMKVTYNVGFKSNGKITGLELKILIDAGMSPDISPVMPHNIMAALKKYNWGALAFEIKVCKTNHSSKTAMRGPGEVQGSFIAEAVIENVASTLSMDVDAVRSINLHTYDSLNLFYAASSGEYLEYTLVTIWDKLVASSSFHQRIKMTKEFNRCNLWKKRGLSRIPIVHEVIVRPTPGKVSILPDGSIVVEVGGIEIGQGLWTKVKQMAAFALGSIECEGDLLDKVRVIQSDTLSLVQGGWTAGSTTSESSCEAVRLCCNTLVERLRPLKDKLQSQMGPVTWETLISQAFIVNLSASSYFVPDVSSMCYLNYGAAVSEVEINILTGETTMLRSDILYDCGQSLNPAVDLGQIEGAFVQGIGFFMLEEYARNSDGLVVANSTWTYKIPTVDTIPRQLNIEIFSSGHHQKRVLSSKASGEPPLVLAASVHCAVRAAIRDAQRQLQSWGCPSAVSSLTELEVPATLPVVKEQCGLDCVEKFLEWRMRQGSESQLP